MLKNYLTENKHRAVLLVGIFCLPWAYPLAQIGLYLGVILLLGLVFIQRSERVFEGPWGGMVSAFVFVTLLSFFTGVDFWRSVEKSYRLSLLLLSFAIPFVLRSGRSNSSAQWLPFFGAYILGAAALGLYDLVRVPLGVKGGTSFFDLGNMRDPQLYMVGLCFLTALLTGGFKPKLKRWGYILFILLTMGLILHFKRGVWLSFGLVFFGAMLVQRRFKFIGAGIVLVALVVMLPPVQDRLLDLKNVADANRGGRLSLWTNVAPPLIKEHPFGLGYRAMKYEHLRAHHWDISAGLNHLHNNLLQVTAELGWIGLVTWLYLMGGTLVLLLKLYRKLAKHNHEAEPYVFAVLLAFLALLLNGMVESNFGDGEIFATYCILFGLSNALWRQYEKVGAAGE